MESVLYKRHPVRTHLFCGTNGSVYKLPKMKLLVRTNREGRPYVRVEKELSIFSHRLIYETFVGKIPNGYVINHKNGIRNDNRIENIECVTHKRNIQHAFETGLHGGNAGERNPNSKLSREDVIKIRERRANGETHLSISKDYSVSRSMVGLICRNVNWS